MEGGGEEVADDRAMNISLKDLSKKLEEFAKARDWEKYHSPRNLLLAMVIKTSSILIYLNNLIFLHACMNLFMSLLLITKHWIFYLFIYWLMHLFIFHFALLQKAYFCLLPKYIWMFGVYYEETLPQEHTLLLNMKVLFSLAMKYVICHAWSVFSCCFWVQSKLQ